jgi:hypothetical protein
MVFIESLVLFLERKRTKKNFEKGAIHVQRP